MILELMKAPDNDIMWDDFISENFKRIALAFRSIPGSIEPDTFGEIQSISVNDKAVTIVNKNVNISVPVNISDLKDIESVNPQKDQALLWSETKKKYVNKNVVATDEKVKLDKDSDSKFLSEFVGKTMMIKDGFLEVKSIDGLNVSITNLNTLAGIEKPIKPILEAVGSSMSFGGTVKTYADLIKTTDPKNGIVKVVLQDENNSNQPYTYVYVESTKNWEPIAAMTIQLRDFTVNPIDLTKEVVGILPQKNMDLTGLAKLEDIKDFLKEDDADKIYVRMDSSENDKVLHESDIINNATSSDKTKPASAAIIKDIKNEVDNNKKITDEAIEKLETKIKDLEEATPDNKDYDGSKYLTGIKRNGQSLAKYDDGTVNVIVPTKTSDLTNDSKFITEDKLKEIINKGEIGSGEGSGSEDSSDDTEDNSNVMLKKDYASKENEGYVKKAEEAKMVEALKGAPPNSVLGVDQNGHYGAYRLPFGEESKYKGIYQLVMLNPNVNSVQTLESSIDLNNCGIFIQAFKLVHGNDDIIAILKEFNNKNKDSFYYNKENISFDNGMSIKNEYIYDVTKSGEVYETEEIDKSQFAHILEVNLND